MLKRADFKIIILFIDYIVSIEILKFQLFVQ